MEQLALKTQLIKQELLEAYVKKDNAQAALKQADERIIALRNVLSGLSLAESAVEKTPEKPSEE